MNILPKISETLYHGTIYKISSIDVTKGRSNKDFGKGFYMAVEKSQAIGIMNKKFNEAVRRSKNKNPSDFEKHLYEITLDKNLFPKLKIKYFIDADIEWLDFVLDCRSKGGVPHDYDLVIGPTADDNTTLCLKNYFDGIYGKVGTDDAKEFLMKNLEVENLGVQYYIGKQEVADVLIKSIKEI